MSNYETVFVKCVFSKGGFPTERLYRITDPHAKSAAGGLVPSYYCFDDRMKRLSDKAEPPEGKSVKGYLEALLIQHNGDGTVQLDLPDGKVLIVSPALLKDEVASVPLER